ncbi:sensor histidine kinase [Pedobacter mucosus]|uniref:sensor histidine kinase n=1 Tax=Pedobacter mucosus TaxID=2895286 RepID=UPI001EE3D606|nr:PAS domain-containing sensor histidine kinase [Pedobacter mucosus]UKT62990.1 PAS domain-containing sensor histidine kinase [Pedobacter mucosus]
MEKGPFDNFEQRFTECDDKFNTIFDLTSVATKIIRSDLTTIKVNAAICDMLGYRAEELEGIKILDLACEDYIDHWHHLQEELWSKQVPFFKLEACLYRKDRTLVWVSVTTILYQDQGETFGFTVLDDISGMKNFTESQKRLDMALKYSGTAIWEMDLRTNKVFRSQDHDEIFGYSQNQNDWTLNSYCQHISEDTLLDFNNAVWNIPRVGGMDVQVKVKDGEVAAKWLNIKGKAEFDKQGVAIKVIGVINDITKDKLLERHKDDFITIASHELKTPVTSLKASLQLLDRLKDDLSERVRKLIVQANKGVNRITLIIDDLLHAGKNYQNQVLINKSNFNLFELAQEIGDQFAASETQAIFIEGSKDIMVYADAERIGRVLTNFIGNAAKYAADSDIIIEIAQTEQYSRVSVTDKGKGISPEKVPMLFNRYYQTDFNQDEYSGLGLGLYISANIIEKHDGRIGVESTPGLGSSFWFELPK